ncbi:MAG: restriction endonuclease subunit S [Emergencia sp.]|nr:restriction endonuclease subunit S [Emergencia sp.]
MRVRLGDHIKEYSVKNKLEEDIPVYSVTNTQGFCRDYFGKEVASKDKSSYKIVPKGYFAYNPSRINVGSVDWQREEDRVIVSPLYNVFSVSEKLDQQYLYYFLKSDITSYYIKAVATGSVRDNLKFPMLCEFAIELPDVKEQKLIVEKLDRIKTIIGLRKEQIKKYDDLIKARFVEMFGQGSYPQYALIELITEGSGLSYGIVQPGDDGTGDMGVLRPVDLVDGRISMAAIKYIDRSIGDGFKKTELTGDELLITVRGSTGITALTDERFKEMNVTRGIAVVRYDRGKVNPVYLNAYLNTDESQQYIQEHTRGATLQQINLSDLRVQKIIVPSMELQEQFAAFVAQVNKSKFDGGKTMAEENLFHQLMALHKDAYNLYKEQTDTICSRDASSDEVEHLLDYMLDFCMDEKFLQLFKRICRRYYSKYPQMITFEINSYKKLYEGEEEVYDDQF